MSKDGITIITRYERGGVVAYSVDEGESFHATVRQALEHQAERTDLVATDSHNVTEDANPPTKPDSLIGGEQ